MSMPPRYGTRKNSTTGKTETYELPTPLDIEVSRRQFRDFIQGNYQWHDDPYKAPKAVPMEDLEDDQEIDFVTSCGY